MESKVLPLSPEREAADRAKLRTRKGGQTIIRRSSVNYGVDGASETTVSIRGAALLVYIRDTADTRRELARHCERHGCVAELVWEAADGEPNGWKIVGAPSALALLFNPATRLPVWWVKRAEYLTTSGQINGRGTGGGELTEGAKRRMRTASALRLRGDETPPSEREIREREGVASTVERLAKLQRLRDAARKS